MFNYAEIDKYITFAHLQLLLRYLETHRVREHTSDMLHSIDRAGDEYTLHVTDAGSGYQHKFRIEGEEVVDLGISGFWMS
ncbi:MAG: hypothetical protein ACRYG7_10285 [Janthinobacterium lividum]